MFGEELQYSKIMSFLDVRSGDLVLAWEDYIYKDTAVSGADPIEERPWLSRLLEDLEDAGTDNRPFDTVIVFKIDRFARKLKVLLDIVDALKTYGVWFISTQESIDTNSSMGTAMLWIMWVFAELERAMIQERTSLWRQEFLEWGGWSQDKYGYRRMSDKYKRPTVYEPEAKIVRLIYEKFAYEKMPIWRICTFLANEKFLIPTFSKKQKIGAKSNDEKYNWTDHTVRKILADEVYIGKYFYNKTTFEIDPETKKKRQVNIPKSQRILSSFEHMPIIDQELFDMAQELLDKKWYYNKSDTNYILSGLLKCDACKQYRSRWMIDWIWKTYAGKRKYYQCAGKSSKYEHRCRVIPLPKQDLEKIVIHEVKSIFNKPELIDKFINKYYGKEQKIAKYNKQLDLLYAKRAKCSTAISNIKQLFVDGDAEMSVSDYKWHLKKHNGALNQIDLSIKSLKDSMKKVVDAEKYKQAIALIKDNTKDGIDRIFSDPQKCKSFLSRVIKEIVVISRNKLPDESIAWKNANDQQIPVRIQIKFRLPQEFMDWFLT